MTKQVENLIEKLGVSYEEAMEIIASDKAIEKGADPFPLNNEQVKASKKARQTSTGVYTFTKRTRKPNQNKRWIIKKLNESITEWFKTENYLSLPVVTNEEREIEFTFEGVKYRLTLSQPREKK